MTIDKLIKEENENTWFKSLSVEICRSLQGNIHGVQSTDTIDFIAYHEVPLREKVTYMHYVCNHCPLKPEPFGVRIIVGGDKLDREINSDTPSTNLTVNSIISNRQQCAKFMSCDLTNFPSPYP